MRRPKGGLDRPRETVGVAGFVRMDEQQVHQVAPARRATASVRAGVGMQLLSDLALDRDEQDVDRGQAQHGQEPRPCGGLGVPRVRRGRGDIHLNRFEAAPGQGTLQCESNRQGYIAVGDRRLPDQREGEVVAYIFGGGALEVHPCRVDASGVLGIEIERHARTCTEPGFECQSAFQRPSIRRACHEAHQQSLKGRLATYSVRGDTELPGAVAQFRLDCGTKARGGCILTHAHRPLVVHARRADGL